MSQNKPWGKPKTETTAKTTTATSSAGKNRTLLDIRMKETKNGKKAVVQLAKNVELFFEGKKVDLGEYNSAFLKNREEIESDLGFFVEKEYMTPEKADEELEFLNSKGITARLTAKV
jgi:hypothetical protein